MNKMITLLSASLLALPLTSLAQSQPQSVLIAEKGQGAGSMTEAVQLQGKVKSINKKMREVVVVGPNGNELLFTLGEEARNFDQIKVGDLVTLTYAQAIAIELRKTHDGIRQRVDSADGVRTKKGEKPGVAIEKSVQVIADVVALNPKAQTVTLRGPKRTVELAVKDPEVLKNVKVGDMVEVVYTEAVALTVTSDKKKK
jgi:hypothetical protein